MFLDWYKRCLLVSIAIMCFARNYSVSQQPNEFKNIYPEMANEQFLHPFFGGPIQTTTENEMEVIIDLEDEDLNDHDIFDGSGDYSMYSKPITFTVPYSPLSTAIVSMVSEGTTPVLARQLVESESLLGTTESPVQCPRACRLSDLNDEERKQLKGDPGPPGVCQCDYEKLSTMAKGKKGEPGESKYLIKLIGKDLPPIRSEVFKEALKQVILLGLKGEKGDPGDIQKKYPSDTEFVTISQYPNLRSYSQYLESLGTNAPVAEVVILGGADSPYISGLYLRFGQSMYDLKNSDASHLLMTSQNVRMPTMKRGPDEEYFDKPRDTSRHERRNINAKISFHNRSSETSGRALSLLKTRDNAAYASSDHLVLVMFAVYFAATLWWW